MLVMDCMLTIRHIHVLTARLTADILTLVPHTALLLVQWVRYGLQNGLMLTLVFILLILLI